MSGDLRASVTEYLEQRRSRGYKLVGEGAVLMAFAEALHARSLVSFAGFRFAFSMVI